jgi:hypothetical protein
MEYRDAPLVHNFMQDQDEIICVEVSRCRASDPCQTTPDRFVSSSGIDVQRTLIVQLIFSACPDWLVGTAVGSDTLRPEICLEA